MLKLITIAILASVAFAQNQNYIATNGDSCTIVVTKAKSSSLTIRCKNNSGTNNITSVIDGSSATTRQNYSISCGQISIIFVLNGTDLSIFAGSLGVVASKTIKYQAVVDNITKNIVTVGL